MTVSPSASAHQHTIGIRRRELLQVGYSALLGVGLPACLARRSLAADAPRSGGGPVRPKSIMLVFLTGTGQPSHHDTFDMKPDAPPEIRGEFQSIATSTRRNSHLRAPAETRCSRSQIRRGPLDVAPRQQSPDVHASRADGDAAAGGLLRQGRLARRLAQLCVGPGLPAAASRRHSQRRQSADVPRPRPAHLAGTARRASGPEIRSVADYG